MGLAPCSSLCAVVSASTTSRSSQSLSSASAPHWPFNPSAFHNHDPSTAFSPSTILPILDSECITEPITDSDLVAAFSRTMPQFVTSQRVAALAAYAFSVGSTVLIAVWVAAYCGGLGWNKRVVFNWHPLLMALAWLVCTTQGTTQLSA